MQRPTILTACALGLALIVSPFAALAQTETPPAAAETEWPFEPMDLEAYARATVEVGEIREEWRTEVAKVDTPDEGQRLRDEAAAKMISAVEEEGLTVDEFNAISAAAESDPDLNAQIAELLTELR